MTKIKPISSMTTPRFADVATFFRLPIVKDLNKLDYCDENLEIINILNEYLNPISCEIYTLQTDNSYTLNINQNIDFM